MSQLRYRLTLESDLEKSTVLSALDVYIHLCDKYREQARASGVFRAARNLRKQGYPIELARAILVEPSVSLWSDPMERAA